jgi:hypothetical protein
VAQSILPGVRTAVGGAALFGLHIHPSSPVASTRAVVVVVVVAVAVVVAGVSVASFPSRARAAKVAHAFTTALADRSGTTATRQGEFGANTP